MYQWVDRARAHGTFKAPDRLLGLSRNSKDMASSVPCRKRVRVERNRPVSHFYLAFASANQPRRDRASRRERFRITIVDTQGQTNKPKCFLALEFRIVRIAPKDVPQVAASC